MDKMEVLDQCVVDGLVVKLPDIKLDRKVYLDVAKVLELIGGRWDRKNGGFLFKADPTQLLSQVASGDKVNLKKEYQFFATPADVADYLVTLAGIKPEHVILEPSAGHGAIIEAILRKNPFANIFAIELMEQNSTILNQKGFNHERGDFLKHPNQPVYDRIIANPPFNKNQDIDHIRHMVTLLKSGGRLVSVASNHWRDSRNKKESSFRDFIERLDAEIIDLRKGTFKESGTNISACIIIIDKK